MKTIGIPVVALLATYHLHLLTVNPEPAFSLFVCAMGLHCSKTLNTSVAALGHMFLPHLTIVFLIL